ncbi:type II toxin-antitoxin system RelE family toxin [Arcicella rigui]|uniref:Type II toxin-antitoxin system RelE/ParE family toxin n=1 Tax=Arcicella rigui TaxID=797020 RepID=A0ABU5QB22_9BACT|nr:type II toxin-antitoxin system RelE/ParE family toxin [Arcicella rigui]MEA5140058.1 type II toxin-antitoxin system RelE/ParE family toxin [Arcicella rigui]
MYHVEISKSAFKALSKLPNSIAEKIENALLTLEENPRPPQSKKLVGFKDLYRLRIGNYRAIYSINDEIITIVVLDIGHRKEIYD